MISTVPSVTFPAWQSLFTGLNPGKLGVFDFVQVDVSKRKYITNKPASFKNQEYAIWNVLNKFGYKSIIINIPTATIEKINGVMVGGPFTFNKVFFHPHNLVSLLNRMDYEQYPIRLTKKFLESKKEKTDINLENLEIITKKTIDSRFELADYLVKTENPDFLALVIFVIDNIQHYFWDEEFLEKIWSYIDYKIGIFLDSINYKQFLILCSDHGFNNLNYNFYISKYLKEKAYLNYKYSHTQKILNLLDINKFIAVFNKLSLLKLIKTMLGPDLVLSISANFPDKNDGQLGPTGLERIIDWDNSYCIPLSSEIYLNCEDSEKEHIINNLKKELEMLTIEGHKIIKCVLTKDQIYHGEYDQKAPDIVLIPEDGIRILDSPYANKTLKSLKNEKMWSGGHTKRGMYVLNGPGIFPTNTNLSIYDIMPTILNIFGIPPPKYIDGKLYSREIVQTMETTEKNR